MHFQIPKKRPEYRQDREHQDFLTTLNQRFASVQAFEDRLVQQLESAFDVTHLSPGEVFDMEASLRTTHAANIGKLIRTQVEEI